MKTSRLDAYVAGTEHRLGPVASGQRVGEVVVRDDELIVVNVTLERSQVASARGGGVRRSWVLRGRKRDLRRNRDASRASADCSGGGAEVGGGRHRRKRDTVQLAFLAHGGRRDDDGRRTACATRPPRPPSDECGVRPVRSPSAAWTRRPRASGSRTKLARTSPAAPVAGAAYRTASATALPTGLQATISSRRRAVIRMSDRCPTR